MRILYVATIGGFMPFFKNIVRELLDEGHTVDFAANQESTRVPEYYKEWGCKVYEISTSRNPFSTGNLKAIKEIRNIAKSYDIVHCHTPLAGMATRLACRKLRKNGLKVIYTAHGFHFYKGAPLKNWLIYFPVEYICSKMTDVLITINKEDYNFAKKKMLTKRIEYIPGVGIDIDRFRDTIVDEKKKREELGVPLEAKIVLSVGELNENKNHKLVIEALSRIKHDNIYYLIAGRGAKKEELESLAQERDVKLLLLGYRSDVNELYKMSDLYILPSIREGLNVSLMEAIASGVSCIASRIRGNNDLINAKYLCNPLDSEEMAQIIKELLDHPFSYENKIRDLENLSYHRINATIKAIYNEAKTI